MHSTLSLPSLATPADDLEPHAQRVVSPCVGGSATALPAHHYSQADLAALARTTLPGLTADEEVLARFFRRVGVTERHLALPAEEYARLDGMEARSKAWLEVSLELGERAVVSALADAGIEASDIRFFATTTVTGIAVPSLEARLMNRLPFRADTKRVPLFGLGCLGGAAGLARTAEYLRAYPEEAALFLSVELCSLTLQRDDASTANLISAGLFGDGAAAVVLFGADHPTAGRTGAARVRESSHSRPCASPRVVDSRSVFFPDTERVMGWDVVDTGFKVVLSPAVPTLVRAEVPAAVDALLADHGLEREDIAAWVSHPGGPAVIAALEEGLGLPPEALEPTRQHLRDVGNLSSASVLFLLDAHRRALQPPPGSYGVLMAMGPAFCAELVLLRW